MGGLKPGGVVDRLTYGIFQNRAPVSSAAPSSSFSTYSVSGSEVDVVGSVGTLYAIIDLLSTSTAQVDWSLYRKNQDGRRVYGPIDDNRRQVASHPALNLLNNPNPQMTRNELIQRTQQSIDLAGESFWLIVIERGLPIEIWPVRADRMSELVSEQNGLVGWKYREPDGTFTSFPANEVIHIQTPNPANMYRGISPVRSLLVDLESVKAAGRFNLNFFKNSARPGGIIQVPGGLQDGEFDRLALQWREQHGGVNNAHRVGILENGATWVESAYNMVDMQFAELRNLSRELIREAYRIHQHMLGQSDDVNRANAIAASADFATWQLIPRLERIEQALNGPFLSLFGDLGQNVLFCYSDPVPMDSDAENAERNSKIDAVVKLAGLGFDPEEALALMGFPPITFNKPEPVTQPVFDAPPTEAQLRAIMNMKAVS